MKNMRFTLIVLFSVLISGSAFALDRTVQIVTSSAKLELTLDQRVIGLFREKAEAAQVIVLPPGAPNGHTVEIEDIFGLGNLQKFPVNVLSPKGETIAGLPGFMMTRSRQRAIFRLYVDGVRRIWSTPQ